MIRELILLDFINKKPYNRSVNYEYLKIKKEKTDGNYRQKRSYYTI